MSVPAEVAEVPHIKELQEENELLQSQLQERQQHEDWMNDRLINVLSENKRLLALSDAQQQIHQAETNGALNIQLGNLLIESTNSLKDLLFLPGRLIQFWVRSICQTPHKALGGENYEKVITAYRQGEIRAVEQLVSGLPVSAAMQANAWTALARELMKTDRAQAAEASWYAYRLDPKPYRLKWLIFRLHEAGDALKAAAMLELLPPETSFSNSEARQAKQLQEEAEEARLTLSDASKLQLESDEKKIQLLRQSGWFDAKWYCEVYPETAVSDLEPVAHYLYQGTQEGKNPGPFFDTNNYLEKNPDVAAAGINPLLHYVQIGIYEGRAASTSCQWLKLFGKKIITARGIGAEPGYEKYTVVSAVYGVEAYLEDFFHSMTLQTLDFRDHIYLIMVDDGSTDRSAEIIRRWQARYPENIRYIHKENGGQASARNLGMQYVKTEWVTFIDPDDFVAPDYFRKVDDFLKKQKDGKLALLSCNFIFYREALKNFSDTHPLKYRFAKGDRILSSENLENQIQLTVNSTFFRTSQIRAQNLAIDERIRPNFEDGHFVGCYLGALQESKAAFLTQPKYYYRKREDGTSTLDTSWQNPGRFDAVLNHGYLTLFESCANRGQLIPKYVQRTILYDLVWHFRYLVNNPERVAFLTAEQQQRYLGLLDTLFAYIDPETILDFELAGCWFMHKVGMLTTFKHREPPFQIVYVERFDHAKNQVLLRYFCGELPLEEFRVNQQDVIPVYEKTTRHDFLNRNFVQERWLWLPLDAQGRLAVWLNGRAARISIGGKQVGEWIKADVIRQHFASQIISAEGQYAGAWLFMDRDTQADDNAEHLYRYVQQHLPEQPAYFLLREDSHDWPRLQAEGFQLIAFESTEHQLAMQQCAKLISSHADHYVLDPFADGKIAQREYIFLQHGVTKDDLSRWLNSKPRIDLFVTASSAEQASIAGNDNRYKFTPKEVQLTGFPRHDALLQGANKREKLILVMPTWRKYLLGKRIGMGTESYLREDFMDTLYARSWGGLLSDPVFVALAQQQGYRVVFFPHAYIQPYLDQFNLPDSIEVLPHMDGSMQMLFQRAALLITDYSSVAFEMAYLQRPVIYWQFDEKDVFNGDHTYQKGYFDYRRDGFGPVCIEKDEMLIAVTNLLARDCQPSSEYAARMHNTFAWRDGKCCERTLRAIQALDMPAENEVSMELLHQHALAIGQHPIALQRWQRYKQLAFAKGDETAVSEAEKYITALAINNEAQPPQFSRPITFPVGQQYEPTEYRTGTGGH